MLLVGIFYYFAEKNWADQSLEHVAQITMNHG